MKLLRTYIAGPMTGLPGLNFPAFHAAAATLRAQGHVVVNPAEINPDHTMPWAECMRRDIAELVACDAIHLLPGWQHSKGATLEHHIAERLGLVISEDKSGNCDAIAMPTIQESLIDPSAPAGCLSNCDTCSHAWGGPANPGHCYMFFEEPQGVCGAHTGFMRSHKACVQRTLMDSVGDVEKALRGHA